jgi:heme-degrading monooxygenase HmoA
MSRIGQPFTCGIWTVRDGSEEEFVTRWTTLVSSAQALPGAEFFLLIQEDFRPNDSTLRVAIGT